jgi:hypothetical protein
VLKTSPDPATVVLAAAALSEADIAALVATHLRRYLQAMVWDMPMDGTEYLTEPTHTLVSLHPNAMSPRGETSMPLETELFLKTKDYAWKSIVSI